MRTSARLLFVVALLAPSAFATDAADSNRGFSANTAFSSGDIDHINLFNGNLIIDIPLAARFPLNGGSSYGVHLIYTGVPWDFPVQTDTYHKPVPNRRSNAGLGWRVSIGRLILPSDVTNPTNVLNDGACAQDCSGYVYESPDGSDHVFYKFMHPNDPVVANVFYTRDSTYLRMKNFGSSFEIEFPDGTIHSFNASDGMLTGIRTPFDASYDSSVTVVNHTTNFTNVCIDSAATSCWELDDRFGRKQFVTFGDTPNLYSGKLLRQIIVTAFGNTTATYVTTYNNGGTDTTLWTDKYCGYLPSWNTPPTYAVPILTSIDLPDGSRYTPTIYNVDTSTLSGDDPSQVACQQGSLYTLTLPTRGKLQYSYQRYVHHRIRDNNSPFIAGVATRKLISVAGAESTWIYSASSDATSPQDTSGTCDTCNENRELKVTVTIPEGHQFVHYFSIAQNDGYTDSSEWRAGEYALPLTHRTGTADTGNGKDGVPRYLSTEVFPAGASTPVRSSYLRYEHDANVANADRAMDDNRRVQSILNVYHDDSDRYSITSSSDYDGFGHYRTTTTTGNFDGSSSRTVTTTYNKRDSDVDPSGLPNVGTYDWTSSPPGAGFTMLSTTDPWVLGTYSSQTTTEGTQTSRTLFCFERTNGFLIRRRAITGQVNGGVWSGVTPTTTDLVQRYTRDSSGNRTTEEYFGGDDPPPDVQGNPRPTPAVATGSLCSLTLGTPTYQLSHAYSYGMPMRINYVDPMSGLSVGYYILDNTDSNGHSGIDLNTGLVKYSKDSAGVLTTFDYDYFRRLKSVTPTGSAVTTYSYTAASTNAPAQVDIVRPSSTAGTVQEQIQYDDFGRVALEKKLMPGNVWTSRQTTYTGSGWKSATSSWETSPTHFTTVSGYDAFGRVGQITTPSPDSKSTTMSYTGVRKTDRTVTIGNSNTASTTHETYDVFGRLYKVEEPGSNSITTYTYDVGNRLAISSMTAGGVTQSRIFRYDNRGLLITEQHPENGLTGTPPSPLPATFGGYDARGHLWTERLSTQTAYDLNYAYDKAEHLQEIDSRNPYNLSQFRLSKTFTHAAANSGANLKAGKLETSTRYNYIPAIGQVRITETMQYNDAAGHLTDKTTLIERNTIGTWLTLQSLQQHVAYNDLDQVASETYPTCQTIGCGAATTDTVTEQHTNGYLTGVTAPPSGIADNGISYAPNGSVISVAHANGIQDAYNQDPTGLPRPSSITFGSYSSCTAPTITTQPQSQQVPYNQSVTLTVVASGSTPLSYQWYRNGTAITTGGTGSAYTTTVTATYDYSVHVFNACGDKGSTTATVTMVYAAPTNLVATQNTITSVGVSFGGSPGADHYELERRWNGSGFVKISNVTSSPFIDWSASANTSYVYRIRAVDAAGYSASAYSNLDLATTMAFTPIAQGQTTIAAAHFSELLSAVNAVRAANGWSAETWNSLGVPAPVSGGSILASQMTILRSRMDQALAQLGLSTPAYTDPTLNSTIFIKAVHVTELRNRTQ